MLNLETKNTIISVAKEYSIEPELLLALIEVESAGKPFWNVGGEKMPPIRFEGHYFYQRLSGSKLDEAIKQGVANKKSGGVKNPRSYAARYALLNKASKIDAQAAFESTSWGLGQIMGAHWKKLGYIDVKDFVDTNGTIEGQVKAIVRYLDIFKVMDDLKDKNWSRVAYLYNGRNYKKNKYHVKLKNAYNKYKNGAIYDDLDILQMQKYLNVVGGYGLVEDGIQGTRTTTTLKDFQLKNGLLVDGVYGNITREELESSAKAIVSNTNQRITNSGTAGAAVGIAITETAKQIEPLIGVSQAMQYLFIGLLILGLVFSLKSLFWK